MGIDFEFVALDSDLYSFYVVLDQFLNHVN